jgi:Lon protease-like protein
VSHRLPLFPLGAVLFPGLVLPLHIFEERYRTLVRELLELPEEERRFGVVAIRQGREVGADGVEALYDVGCVAHLRRAEGYDDGRFDIVSTGTARFRLEQLDVQGPYLRGEVEVLEDEMGPAPEAPLLDRAVRAAFIDYLAALSEATGDEIEVPELPDSPLVLGYLVAATTALDLDERQRLLAEADGASRLRAELALLRRERTLLRHLSAAPAPELTRGPVSPN